MEEIAEAPLLLTKITAPAVRARDVRRARLLERIPNEPGTRLLLVSAPAGSGKTTLLASWRQELVSHDTAAVAWYSLDARDNDPRRFGAYLVAALMRAADGAVDLQAATELLHAKASPGLEAALAVVVNAIATAARNYVLILDDYHTISAAEVHLAVAYLLDHLPPQLRVAIGSRADPPLQLARLRVRDQLVELRPADLRFDPDEIRVFFHNALRLSLGQADAQLVETVAEGWAAGIQMLALSLSAPGSMRGGESFADMIARVGGQQRQLFDYLADEVFDQQPPEVRRFLLLTSVLDQLSAPLCDAIAGSVGAPQPGDGTAVSRDPANGAAPTARPASAAALMLDRLEHTNLFLAPLAGGQGWYRYHHLFHDFLRERLRREYADWIPALHRRAAAWYRQAGMAPPAIEHALAAGDDDTACDLLESVAEATTARGEYATVHGWLARLPDGAREDRPALSLWLAWDAILRGRLDASEQPLAQAERRWHAEGNRARLGEVWHARAHLARLRGVPDETIRYAQAALADLPAEALTLRAGSMFALGAGSLSAGDLARAEATLQQARPRCQASNELALLSVVVAQGDLLVARGQLHDAVARYDEALALVGARAISGHFEAQIRRAEIWREWNQLERAFAELRAALTSAEQTSHDTHLPYGYVAVARTLHARGEAPQAMAALDQAVVTAERLGSGLYRRQARAQQARLQLAQGDVEAARRWQAEADLDPAQAPAGATEAEYLVLARLLVAGRRCGEAIALLHRLLDVAKGQGRSGSMVTIQLLLALALEGDHRQPEALLALEQATARAEPGGYLRSFLDEGPTVAELLRQGLAIGGWGLRATPSGALARGYARALLAAFGEPAQARAAGHAASDAPCPVQRMTVGGDALSARELEVLRLMARGASNQAIADSLVISQGTVKSHLNHIMRKLEAHNRTEAVAHAREVGWLPH